MGGQALRVDDADVARWSALLGRNSVREDFQIGSRLQPQAFNNVSGYQSNPSHSSPSLPNKHGAEGMGDTSDLNRRISVDHKHEARTRLRRSLETHVTDPAKVVARKVDASPDTVEAHRREIPKSWAQMIAYCRAYPAFALDVVEAMGLDIDRDREAYSMFLQLQKQVRGE